MNNKNVQNCFIGWLDERSLITERTDSGAITFTPDRFHQHEASNN